MGSGKSLGMLIFTWYYSLNCKANVLSNLPLREEAFAKHKVSKPDFWLGYLQSEKDFVELARRGGGIIAWDEMHQSMDNRTWARKTQVMMTEFFMYLRKIGAPLFFTSQSIRNQLDVRVRNVLDVAVLCSKSRSGFCYEFYDFVSGLRKKRIFIPREWASKFFAVYDTRRIVRPVSFPETEREYVRFLDDLQKATEEIGKRSEIQLDPMFQPFEEEENHDVGRGVSLFLPIGGSGASSKIWKLV